MVPALEFKMGLRDPGPPPSFFKSRGIPPSARAGYGDGEASRFGGRAGPEVCARLQGSCIPGMVPQNGIARIMPLL